LCLIQARLDDAKVLLLGTALTGLDGQWPLMTSGPDPLWVIYGGPFTPWFAKLAESFRS